MTLIVEDGSIVAGANSYVDDAEALLIADDLAVSLPATSIERESVLKKGAWYLDEKGFCGERVSASQSLAFPRNGIYLHGFELSDSTIPIEIKRAQVAAAAGYFAGAQTNTINDGRQIKKEKLDVLEVEYFQNGKTSSGDRITFADKLVKPLICSSSRFKNVERC